MKEARRFVVLHGFLSLFQKPHSHIKLSSVNATRSKSQSSLRQFLVLIIIACGLYIAIYYTVASSSICRWSTILSLSSLPKSGPFSSSLQHVIPQDEVDGAAGVVTEETSMYCKLPNLDPFHPSIIELIHEPDKLECANETWPNAFFATFSTLRQVKPFPRNATYNCCFKPFTRSTHSDKEIQYSETCHRIPPWQEVKVEEEFVHVFCIDSTSDNNQSFPVFQDMFAFVPLKPSVEARISSQDSKQSEGKSSLHAPPVGQHDKLNIVILGLDGQSRMNLIRQMPLTHSYLISNLSAISLQGYTKVADNTFPNTVPLLTGLSIEELQKTCWPTTDSYFDDCPFIWKNFSAHGYRTSFGEDSVWMGIFNYVKKGFRHPPTDYYLNPFSKYINDELGHESLGNSELCYGPRQSFQVLLDYIRNTAAAFNASKPYFQFVWSAGLFHDYLNVPKLGDSLLFNTLHFLHSQNYLNQTLFILMSDHGPRWGDIRETFQGKIEERMPFVYLTFPPWFHSKYPHLIKNLNLNSNRLTTAFDLHLLLRDMLYLPKYRPNFTTTSSKASEKEPKKSTPRAYSLFQIIPPSRTCEEADIANHWCVCDAMVELPLNTTFLESAASSVVSYVNEILNPVSNICAKLQLNRIIQAVHLIQYNNEEPDSSNFSASSSSLTIPERITIQINLETHPGDALFEATLTGFWSKANVTTFLKDNNSDTNRNSEEWDYTNWEISQTVSRINSYASQATCISDFKLEKYCFCQTHSSNQH